MSVVLDASALLAALLQEPGSDVVEEIADDAIVGSVNLAEVVAALARDGNDEASVRAIVDSLTMEVVPTDAALAIDVGLMRVYTDPHGLSLGDRFCLALAKRLDAPAYTGDRAWMEVADVIGVDVRLIR